MKNKQKTVTIEASKVLFHCTHSLSEGVLVIVDKFLLPLKRVQRFIQ